MPDASTTNARTASKPILIMQAGNTFPDLRRSAGDFDDWISAGLGRQRPVLRMDAREMPAFPHPSDIAGVVVSGSSAMVTDREPWSERLAAWLRACVEAHTPVLGICYGHQLLAHALGGRVDYRREGIEIGTEDIALADAAGQDPLFTATPPIFPAQMTHSQSVLELPPGAVRLASSRHEPNQAFRAGTCAWGFQFHPEFSAAIMREYIARRVASQDQADALASAVRDTPDAAGLLKKFAAVASGANVASLRLSHWRLPRHMPKDREAK